MPRPNVVSLNEARIGSRHIAVKVGNSAEVLQSGRVLLRDPLLVYIETYRSDEVASPRERVPL
jgi:hypothetical protein